MLKYDMPVPAARPLAPPRTAYLVASGDLRESANAAGWPTQLALEQHRDGRLRRGGLDRRPR